MFMIFTTANTGTIQKFLIPILIHQSIHFNWFSIFHSQPFHFFYTLFEFQ